ncbi:MAG TPA: signal peptidase II, partial [Nakamurella sp.]|nr:signal peptidase II [Nakamurella sp.]
MVAVVGGVDQAAKAWAWRNLVPVHVNTGGDMLVGPVVSGWFRDRATGTVFDLLDAALLASIGALLVRRRRPPALLGGGALALAGWVSNLTDRLGLHLLTAPGTRRGVVDFLPWQRRYWNLADLAITAGTAVFGLALIWHATRTLTTH